MTGVVGVMRGDLPGRARMVLVAVLATTGLSLIGYGLTLDAGSSSVAVARQASGVTSEESPPAAPDDDAGRRDLAVYFGDSYFVGALGQATRSSTMARLSAKRLGYAAVRVRGGAGTGFARANPVSGVPPYLQQVRAGALQARQPDLIVIEGGSNDTDQAKWRVRRNAGLVLALARSKHPDAMLVLVGPLDVDGDLADTTPVNGALRKEAAERGVPYLDVRRWLAGHRDLVGPDGIHPTAEGHQLLGRKLARALAALGA